MRTAIIAQVRVEPELRSQLEAVLRPGDTLSEFVEAPVRNAVEFRRVQSRLHECGQTAWENHQRSGLSIPADVVLNKLQAKINAKRKQLGG